MRRKIVKHGPASLTISLPAKWVQKQGLKAGDEIEVAEEGNKLVINDDKEKGGGEITFDVPAGIPFARRFLYMAYIRGYNTIKIYFHDIATSEKIIEVANDLLGFEIVEQGKYHYTIKNIAKGIESEFDSMFNRQILVALSEAKELYDAAMHEDYKIIENLLKMEELSNKLNLFCRRMLNTQGYKDSKKTIEMYHITCLIESIADNYKRICRELLNKRIKLSKNCLELMKLAIDYFEIFYKQFNKFNISNVADFKKVELRLEKLADDLQKNPTKEIVVVCLLRAINNDIHHATEELLAD